MEWLVSPWKKCNVIQAFWRVFYELYRKTLKIFMPLYSAIPFPGINHKEVIRTVDKVLYVRMFMEALFVKGKNGNNVPQYGIRQISYGLAIGLTNVEPL